MSRIERGPASTDLARLIWWAEVLQIPQDQLWFALPERPAPVWPRPERQGRGLRVVAGGALAGELVEVVVPDTAESASRPVVRVGRRPVDPSAPVLDATVAALVASARALLAVMAGAGAS